MGSLEPVLLKCHSLLPCARCGVEKDVYVYIEDGIIQSISKSPLAGMKTGYVIECPHDSILAPCMYNAHIHAVDVVFTGMLETQNYEEARAVIPRLWAYLPSEVAYEAAKLVAYNAIMRGSCGFIDMSPFPKEVARAAREIGIRATVGEVVIGDIDEEKALDAAVRTMAEFSAESNGLIRGVVNIYDIRRVDFDKIKYIVSQAHEKKLGVQIHISETRREVYEVKKETGLFPIELLDRSGLLNENTILVNAGWIASWELEAVKRSGASLVTCPTASMRMVSGGHFPLREALEKGVRVGLGSDSPAMSHNLDVLIEAEHALLFYRHAYWDAGLTPEDILGVTQSGNAEIILGRMGSRIEEGAIADLTVLGLSTTTPWKGSIAARLVYSGATSLYTIVNGVIVFDSEARREEIRSDIERLIKDLSSINIDSSMVPESDEMPCFPRSAC
jgi:cytosine/adenosine deaminase-related metal-dependent hydrolase